MIDLAQNGLPHAQVLRALQHHTGAARISFGCDVIRRGARVRRAELERGGEVNCNSLAQVKLTCRLKVKDDPMIDWFNDRLRPYMLVDVNGFTMQYPLGMYVPSTVVGNRIKEVEGYDLCVYLQEDSITERLYFPRGMRYTDAVSSVLVSAGVANASLDQNNDILLSDREDWEIGTSKLVIVNQLLGEINFRSLETGLNGNIRARQYLEPTGANVSIQYRAGDAGIVLSGADKSNDSYNVPNVFVGVVSNPDYTEDGDALQEFKYTYINSSPASALSTASRGRRIVAEIIRPDNIASQAALQAYVRRSAIDSMTVYEHVSFRTTPVPYHEVAEVLGMDIDGVQGVYGETSWSLPLDGSPMRHECRKLVVLR